jgi:AcrR family transcriptional regulator
MARRRTTLDLGSLLAGIGDAAPVVDDEATAAVLDAASSLMAAHGMRRWSMDDVAERAGLGRATLYRRFDGREDLVHAALARDARRFFASVADAVSEAPTLEDKVVDGFLVGLRVVRDSLIPGLIQTDTATALSLLTSGPVLALARAALVERYEAITGARVEGPERHRAELVAETLVRLGISFILVPESMFDLDDQHAAAEAVRQVVSPLLGARRTSQPMS